MFHLTVTLLQEQFLLLPWQASQRINFTYFYIKYKIEIRMSNKRHMWLIKTKKKPDVEHITCFLPSGISNHISTCLLLDEAETHREKPHLSLELFHLQCHSKRSVLFWWQASPLLSPDLPKTLIRLNCWPTQSPFKGKITCIASNWMLYLKVLKQSLKYKSGMSRCKQELNNNLSSELPMIQ